MIAQPDPSPALQRHVEPTRRRQLWWWALAGTAAANAAFALAVADRSSGRLSISMTVQAAAPLAPAPAPVVILQAPPAPVAPVVALAPAPPPLSTAFAELGPCPTPHTGRPRARVTQPADGDLLIGVAASPTDSRLVAAWTPERVFVSRDGGGTWDRVLDGSGAVRDVTFDCHGRAVAVRVGAGLGVRDGARETWRAIAGVALTLDEDEGVGDSDQEYRPRLVGGGRAVAVIGAATQVEGDLGQLAAITDDLGLSWRPVDLGWYERAEIAAAWTGDTLRLGVPWTDCMSEGLNLVTVTPAGVRTTAIDEYAGDVALAGASLLANGNTCAAADGGPGHLCAWRSKGGWTALPALPAVADEAEVFVLVDGPIDLLVIDDHAYRVDAAGLGRARPWSRDWKAHSVDRAGRLWGLSEGGQLVRA